MKPKNIEKKLQARIESFKNTVERLSNEHDKRVTHYNKPGSRNAKKG